MEITNTDVKRGRGRPTKYKEDFPEKVRYYTDNFDTIEEDTVIPTVAGLSLYLGITKQSIYDYAEQYPDFLDSVKYLQSRAEKILVSSTLNRKFAEKFATFYAINCLGYSDKREIKANVEISSVEDILRNAEDTEEY